MYGDLPAVDHVDLEVCAGEVFGFLGPNGAGKSTTIKCLLDLARPTSGTASILGLDSHADSLAIRRRIGYLPGDLALYPKLTGREHIAYFANLRGGIDDRMIDSLADRFDADLSRRCSEYSSGNRQKVGLIQAFMHEPDVVILDEPSTGLDPLVQQSFHELVGEVRDSGRTVFLSSHTLSEVDRIADRVGIIRHGKLVEVAAIGDLKARAVRKLDFEFASPSPVDPGVFRSIEGVRDVDAEGSFVHIAFDGSIEPILDAATGHGLVNLHTRDADLEEIFLEFYRDAPTAAGDRNAATDDEEDRHVAHQR
jgi:ABC-2 type transport system ATP-binding protein